MAEKLARETLPALLVVDFDPPLPGALGFFTRLRSELPEMRVLIIAAGLPPELLHGRRVPSAFQFIEKPFQLPAFGNTIQEMLDAADDETGSDPAGTLRDLNLSDVLPLLCLEGASCILQVTSSADGRSGLVQLVRGQIRHAAVPEVNGIDALREMFAWEESHFALDETGATAAPASIEGLWPGVLRRMLGPSPRRRPRLGKPSTPPKTKPAPTPALTKTVKDGKKVVIVDDTETLLDFVAEMLAAADPHLEIVTAANASDGLAACITHRPDLILLDYSLPDFNGDEVCRRLLARDETKAIPVIMMSGHVAQMAATAAGFENVVFTLAKPFLSAAMVDIVSKTLANPPQLKPPPVASETKQIPLTPAAPTAPEIAKTGQRTNGKKLTPHPEPPAPPLTPPVAAPMPAVSYPTSAPQVEAPATATMTEPDSPAEVSLTPARLATTQSDAVVVSFPLEIISMQFSPALQITALRARPSSTSVAVQVDPRSAPSLHLPGTTFDVDRVDLGGRGQIQTIRLGPAERPLQALVSRNAVAIEQCAVLPSNGSGALQLTPATTAPLPIQLLMAFDLAGVELSPTFGLSHLALKARGGRVRVILPGQSGDIGVIFESAQVLLHRSGRIAEILLDSVVS